MNKKSVCVLASVLLCSAAYAVDEINRVASAFGIVLDWSKAQSLSSLDPDLSEGMDYWIFPKGSAVGASYGVTIITNPNNRRKLPDNATLMTDEEMKALIRQGGLRLGVDLAKSDLEYFDFQQGGKPTPEEKAGYATLTMRFRAKDGWSFNTNKPYFVVDRLERRVLSVQWIPYHKIELPSLEGHWTLEESIQKAFETADAAGWDVTLAELRQKVRKVAFSKKLALRKPGPVLETVPVYEFPLTPDRGIRVHAANKDAELLVFGGAAAGDAPGARKSPKSQSRPKAPIAIPPPPRDRVQPATSARIESHTPSGKKEETPSQLPIMVGVAGLLAVAGGWWLLARRRR